MKVLLMILLPSIWLTDPLNIHPSRALIWALFNAMIQSTDFFSAQRRIDRLKNLLYDQTLTQREKDMAQKIFNEVHYVLEELRAQL